VGVIAPPDRAGTGLPEAQVCADRRTPDRVACRIRRNTLRSTDGGDPAGAQHGMARLGVAIAHIKRLEKGCKLRLSGSPSMNEKARNSIHRTHSTAIYSNRGKNGDSEILTADYQYDISR
jgi:hypothetical protein